MTPDTSSGDKRSGDAAAVDVSAQGYRRFVGMRRLANGMLLAIMAMYWHAGTTDIPTLIDKSSFPRDMQWGQGLQLIEDLSQAAAGMAPAPFVVTEGEWLILVTRYSADGVTLQFQLERDIPRAD